MRDEPQATEYSPDPRIAGLAGWIADRFGLRIVPGVGIALKLEEQEDAAAWKTVGERDKERDLRVALREIRRAIDMYKDAAAGGSFQVKVGTEGYPETLEMLVEGVVMSGAADGKKVRFLRRIPKDPMTNTYDWGLRSVRDDPKSMSWGGDNVFDVYSKSYERARDGTPYSEW